MGSVTAWARIEPHSRAADMESALEMRVHDPLWMLARQWQFGEFQGEDTGSPVWASARGETGAIELYLPGPLQGHQSSDVQTYSPDQPLQFLIQREHTPAQDAMTANRRLAVEAGQHFLTLLGRPLAASYRAMLLQSCAVQSLTASERAATEADSVAFLDLAAGRALDGVRLLTALADQSAEAAAAALGFEPGDVADAAQAIRSWLEWCASMVGEVSPAAAARSAWDPQRMEYTCALAAPTGRRGGDTVLLAEAYSGGPLDWFSFDMKTGTRLARAVSTRTRPLSAATLPTGLSFRGMPANRLWEMEDAQVRFGAIEAGPTDLARLLLVEFLIEYGNDFFAMPLDVDSGVLAHVETLTVTNTFGDVTAATPFANEEWRLFALSDDRARAATASTLFLPPVLGEPLVSAPLEQVDLVRDEMANLSWAIEHIVQSKSGTAVNRHETWQAQRQRDLGDRRPREGTLTYRLDTLESTLPDFWLPLLPEQSAPGESVARVACYDPQQRVEGRLLSEKNGAPWLYLFDEEIPRSGARITRLYQYTRWYDGGIFSWIGRQKKSGRGSASSGLRYDVLGND